MVLTILLGCLIWYLFFHLDFVFANTIGLWYGVLLLQEVQKHPIPLDVTHYNLPFFFFKQLYKDGLAKQVDMPVNWCEELGTVLANDEIIDGKSERGGFPVVRKNMKQFFPCLILFFPNRFLNYKPLDTLQHTFFELRK